MAIDRSVQPMVKDASGVLVGVAQIRVGLPSIRPAGTAIVRPVTAVGASKVVYAALDGTTEVVKPADVYAANTGSGTFTSSGTYTGATDGAFIIRALNATTLEVWSPNGYKNTAITVAAGAFSSTVLNMDSGAPSGLSLSGASLTNITAGDTWILPVWSGLAQTSSQTNIITPFSPLIAANSVGGLKSSKMGFNIGSVKKLESGFPTYVADQIIDSTSISVGWDSLEFNNASIQTLRNMMNEVINNGNIASIPCEILCRTRGGALYAYWCPSTNFSKFPEISPTNDYSSAAYEMEALKMTEITGAPAYRNAWLTEAPLYAENRFTH